MRKLMDDVDVAGGANGTTVKLRKRLAGAAVEATAAG